MVLGRIKGTLFVALGSFSPSTLPSADLNTPVEMSFSASSQNAWLEHGHILHAKCEDSCGNLVDSTIDLNHYIGNSDGKLP